MSEEYVATFIPENELKKITLEGQGHPVKVAARKKKRDRLASLGNDILNYIIELVTNADDSYKRLGVNAIGDKIIEIEVIKDNNIEGGYIISVTDNAEGMTCKKLLDVFTEYAGDNAGGPEYNPRGIFGQGGSDVLKNAAAEGRIATIETIKDGTFSRLVYELNDDYQDGRVFAFPMELSKDELADYRRRLNIPQNGTKVSFGVPSNVKFDSKEIEKLPKRISTSAYLRYLLNQEDVKVSLKIGQNSFLLSSADYQFKEEDKITSDKFSINFEGEKLECELKLYKNENKNENKTEIIVKDDYDRVYDNTMFDFRNNAASRNISGELMIKSFYQLFYNHINDPERPNTIINDNRSGFKKEHPFYIALNEKVYPILNEVISENKKNVTTINLSNNRQFDNLVRRMNQYFKKEGEEDIPGGPGGGGQTPPAEGIKFARPSISITEGKQYNLKLVINSHLIPSGERINVSCDSDKLEFTPMELSYDNSEDEKGIVIKNVSIKGLEITEDKPVIMEATVLNYSAKVVINVIEEEIHYPENGLEFIPNSINIAGAEKHRISLYVDSSIIPIGTVISVRCDDGLDHVRTKTFSEANLINDSIGLVKLWVSGGEIGKKYSIEASALGKTASALITITEEGKRPPQNNGLISRIEIRAEKDLYEQSYYEPHTRILVVNSEHPINMNLMGDLKELDPNNPNLPLSKKKCFYDVVASRAATTFVNEVAIRLHNDIGFNDDSLEFAEKYARAVQEQKNRVYAVMVPEMLDK